MSSVVQSDRRISDRDQRDALIFAHLSTVRHVVSKLAAELPPGMDTENLEAAGMLGLVEAAGNFNPSRGVDFKLYATSRIRGAVLDELRRNCPLPQRVLERVARVRKAHRKLTPPVSIDSLAEATGLAHDEVLDCLAAIRLTQMLSWEQLAQPVATRLDPRSESPHESLERDECKRVLAEAIALLPERERMVVTLYYLEDLRLKEIGQVLKISESRVSRLLNESLFQVGEFLRAKGM